MRLIDADDLYQKCIEIQLKKRNRYFDIDDVMKLIKKASASDVLDKIRAEIDSLSDSRCDGTTVTIYSWNGMKKKVFSIIDKYKAESEVRNDE